MRMSRIYTSLFVFLVLTASIFAQEPERWSKPFLRLEPSSQVSPENFELQAAPVDLNYNPTPLRTVFPDKTYTVYPNIRVWPQDGGSQSELHIAVNPNNPNIILGGSNAANTAVTYLNQGYYVSTNGGQTWFGSDSLPGKPSGYYRSDPVVDFDLNGNMYFNTLEYSSSAGDLVTLKSTNNGLTWGNPIAVPNPGIDEDKNWIAVDKTPTSPYVNYIYTAYTEFQSTGPNYRQLEFSRSTDGGVTYSAPINMSGTTGYLHQGVNLAVAPNGNVVAAFTHYPTSVLTSSHVTFAKSTDGGLTFTQQFILQNIFDIRGNLTKGGNTIRVNSFPYIDVDRSNGPRKGRIFVTWAARPASGQSPDVFLSWSDNNGSTWTTPKRVNADSALTNRDQWFPALAVDPADGSVNICYYDSRNFTANDSAEVYMSRSVDGGVTFEDIKVTDAPHKPQSISGLATGYQGDYIGIAAKNGVVWPFWNDRRLNRPHNAYTAKVFFIQIQHPPLGNTENLAGPYYVGAKISASLPITNAKVYWRRGTTGAFDSLTMTRIGTTDSFYANIPGNNNPATYNYYLYAQDNAGSYATLPGGAPSSVFSFEAAADNISPTVTHTVLPNQYRETWSPTVTANVTDNIGVDSVRVNYRVRWNGTPRQFYMTKGSGDSWSGVFNIDTTLLAVGDTVYYRITARDKGTAGNYGYHPSATTFNSFLIIGDTEFPVITHTALRDQAKVRWPSVVKTQATDNLMVDSVWVEWYKNNTGNWKRFNLAKMTGDNWEAAFNSDTNQVAFGDSIFYRIAARDRSTNRNITYSPASGYHKFKIIQTKGLVLVIDDDATEFDRISTEKAGAEADLTTPLGASAALFKAALDSVGYLADLVTFTAFDITTLANFDIVILTAGSKTSAIFNDQGKRDAIRNFASQTGKKTWVEGGEVGYFFRSTGTNDQVFRQQVLFTEAWVSDASSGILNRKLTGHPINSSPNTIPDNLTLTGTAIGVRDAMKVLPGAKVYPVSTWSSHPDSGGIIVNDKNPNPVSADNVFYTFNIGVMVDQVSARKLIENTADYLMAVEAPPTGKITGTVTLTGAPNSGGVVINLTGVKTATTTTASNGTYSFDSLYSGAYRVTAVAPTGYFPYTAYIDTTVGTTTVSGINFTFNPILPSTVSGTVTVTGAPNNGGVLVEIIGQAGKTATTNTTGSYTISNVNPGNIQVKFSKVGFGPKVKDTTLTNGGTTIVNMTLVPTLGVVLIVDDFTTTPGPSATLFKNTLDSLGYDATLTTFAALDTNTLGSYQLVILSAGQRTTTMFADKPKRDAIRNYINFGGKTLVEGGQVPYIYRIQTTEYDKDFREQVLFTGTWVTSATSTANIIPKRVSHPIYTDPHALPSSIPLTGTGTGVRDVVLLKPNDLQVYNVANWSTYPDSSAIIVRDRTPDPASADNITFAFDISAITDQSVAKKMLENTAKFIFKQESAATGKITGDVTLTGATNHGGVVMNLLNIGTGQIKSTVTASTGAYSFDSLFNGNYRVTSVAPTGYFPYTLSKDTSTTGGTVSGINFTFQVLVNGTISGTVQLAGQTNHSGVLVEILNQPGKNATSSSTGAYSISAVAPGNVLVKFSKSGFKTTLIDTFLANGGTLVLNRTLPTTLGNVLVIDDDVSETDRISEDKPGEANLAMPLGAAATLFKSTLDSIGYNADLVTFAALDTNQLAGYDIVILSTGAKSTNIFNDAGKRLALRNYARRPNAKTWAEGGEIGYFFRNTNTTADSFFRKEILHTSRWISDATAGTIKINIPGHPIFTIPNLIPDNVLLTGTSIYTRDAMAVDWEPKSIYHAGTWSSHLDSGSVIVHDKNPNPLSADNIFFSFNIAMISDLSIAQKLIQNTANYLRTAEPPPTGSFAGTVTLTGKPNNSGATVKLFKLPTMALVETFATDSTGNYTFSALYAGAYRIQATPPVNFYPAVVNIDTTVGTGPITGLNFSFISTSSTVAVSFSTAVGWNLLSMPVKVANMSKTSLFPASTSNAFAFSEALGYTREDTLKLGVGYWLKFAAIGTHNFTAAPSWILEVPVKSGWNMIGASHTTIPVTGIYSTPPNIISSPFFVYAAGYSQATDVTKGKGYWVKTNNDGKIYLASSYPKLNPSQVPVEVVDNIWPTMIITDAAGNQTKLYFGSNVQFEGRYELPPVPPSGVFDVRFQNNKYVEDASIGKYQVALNSAAYPVRIRLENFDETTFSINDGLGGIVLNERIKNNEEVVIANSSLSSFTLEKVVIPTVYEMSQNYPNPFNPSTVIRFGLPEDAKVRLEVYNTLGERVAELVNKELEAGYYSINFDASKLSTGVYFYRIQTSKFTSVKKMMFLK